MTVFLVINLVIAALSGLELQRALRTFEVSVPLSKTRLGRGANPAAFWTTIGFWAVLMGASAAAVGQGL